MDPIPARRTDRRNYATTYSERGKKLCDAVYSFHEPDGLVEVEVVFIHGLQLTKAAIKNAYWRTWIVRDRTKDNCWPMTWLPEKFPNARVLSVSYDGSALKTPTTGRMDAYLLGESLVQQMTRVDVGIGQKGCPVVFVCHSLGGLIAKEIVVSGHRCFGKDKRVRDLLENVKAFFFYATPHGGSKMADWAQYVPFLAKSPLVEYLRVLDKNVGRLNSEFDGIHQNMGKSAWKFYVVAESLATQYGIMSAKIVEEASARHVGCRVMTVGANHFDVCKPERKTDSGFQYLTTCIREVIDERRNWGQLFVFEHKLVGIEGRVQEVQRKMADHCVVGLVGMGGIGKTTLSKRIFDEVKGGFERCCFLEDVKSRGGEACRRQLSLDLCGKKWNEKGDVWRQMEIIKESIIKGKVLVVVDDVGNEENMKGLLVHAFKDGQRGSRVIVTTREHETLDKYRKGIIEVELLSDVDALELFSSYAFDGVDDTERMQLDFQAKAIVKACGNLPLSLEVTGQYFRRRNFLKMGDRVKIWEEALTRLKKAESLDGSNDERLWARLKISYDDLAEGERRMFLDFACIICETCSLSGEVGVRKDWVARVWGSWTGVWNLISRSLIKWKGKEEVLVMHDQLRDLGRSIVREEMCGSRIWEREGLSLTLTAENCNTLEGLVWSREEKGHYDGLECTTKQWTGEQLRLLNLRGSNVGVVEHYIGLCTAALNWLCLDWSWITCKSIEDVGLLTGLRVLEMQRCFKLEGLPSSISKLSELRELNLADCVLLKTLPDSIHALKKLEVLDISGCYSLFALPACFGGLKSLEKLRVGGCKIQNLPDSFEQLGKLEFLDLSGCGDLVGIPDSLGVLQSMQELRLEGSGIQCLPNSVGQLLRLEVLNLSDCGDLVGLPESIGGLQSMQELRLQGSGIQHLPNSVGQLAKLKVLDLSDCGDLVDLPDSIRAMQSMRDLRLQGSKIQSLPNGVGQLVKLEFLDLSRCKHLVGLPDSVRALQSMRELRLVRIGIKGLPSDVGQMSKLEFLDLSWCKDLVGLPESVECLQNMRELRLQGSGIRRLPSSVGLLAKLEVLDLIMCEGLVGLPESVGGLQSMRELRLQCSGIQSLPDGVGQLAKLELLELRWCKHLVGLPNSVSGLQSLQKLMLSSTKIKRLPNDVGQLVNLKVLELDDCEDLVGLPDLVGGLQCLEVLDLSDCKGLVGLPESVGDLRSMRELRLQGSGIQSLPDSIGQLAKLEVLDLSRCEFLVDLPKSVEDLQSMPELRLRGSGIQSLRDNVRQVAKVDILDPRGCVGVRHSVEVPKVMGRRALQNFSVRHRLVIMSVALITTDHLAFVSTLFWLAMASACFGADDVANTVLYSLFLPYFYLVLLIINWMRRA